MPSSRASALICSVLRSNVTRPSSNPQRISKKMDGLGFGLAGLCLPVDSSAMRLLQSTYPLRLSGCISPLYPVGRGWRMVRHGRDQSLSYSLAELENSNPQRIFPASGFLGKTYALRLSGCISPIACGLGWRHGRDQSLSYLLAELESSNPQRIFPASGFLGKGLIDGDVYLARRINSERKASLRRVHARHPASRRISLVLYETPQ